MIQSTIVNELLEADLVIADLTDNNPNVLFESGLRMAEEKPVALIKAAGTGQIPAIRKDPGASCLRPKSRGP